MWQWCLVEASGEVPVEALLEANVVVGGPELLGNALLQQGNAVAFPGLLLHAASFVLLSVAHIHGAVSVGVLTGDRSVRNSVDGASTPLPP